MDVQFTGLCPNGYATYSVVKENETVKPDILKKTVMNLVNNWYNITRIQNCSLASISILTLYMFV